MKLGQFLRETVGIKFRQIDLYALDKLAGQQVCEIQFYANLKESFGQIEDRSYTSPFFYPLGYYERGELGLHLHPYYLKWEDIIVACNDHNDIFDRASTLAYFLFRHLLKWENICYEEEENPHNDETLVEATNIVNAAFGENFYQIGRFGKMYPDALEHCKFDPPTKVSLVTAAKSVLVNLGWGNAIDAARQCNLVLGCHRNTTGYFDRDKFYALCRTLLAQYPEHFTSEAKQELTIDRNNKNALATWCVDLYKAGNKEWTLKVLLDLCETHCSYNHPIAHHIMVKLLGDTPVGRWVQYRQIEFNSERQENYEDWEETLFKIV
ncbi:hypothetical protein [Spirulina sp. 06S082]|uniref:hypothetical protein n=1 Tax=Spirulina sp. 06S082 TaxID=3110248 RepID=UPI002B1FC216|nr:hypothetical protein [Spirulina sp. 06S082]MEA5470716.1 hypothetical protein [Spirulina sp. 06S082]